MFIQQTADLLYAPKRIVSLVPSQTELLFELGLHESVVGITKFCIHPSAWRKTKTIVGGTKKILIETVKNLNPDLIIANKEENTKHEIEILANDFTVWVTDVASMSDALIMIQEIGELTRTEQKATDIISQIKNNFNQIEPIRRKIKTCYLIWQDPFMTVGGDTFINDLLQHCGFDNLYSNEKRYPVISIEELKTKCELLLLSSEPYPFKHQHINALQTLLPETKILLANGEFFCWYGSRLIKAPYYFNSLTVQLT